MQSPDEEKEEDADIKNHAVADEAGKEQAAEYGCHGRDRCQDREIISEEKAG